MVSTDHHNRETEVPVLVGSPELFAKKVKIETSNVMFLPVCEESVCAG